MFEISFGELLLIGAVALVVLGPERLPTVARTIGALIGRAQRFVSSVKADIQRETNAAGLDGLRQDLSEAANAFQQRIESEVDELNQGARVVEQELHELGQAAVLEPTPVAPGQPQVTEAQLAHLDALGEPAQFTDHGPLFEERFEQGFEQGFAEPALPAPVDDNQLDLFAEPAPATKQTHA